MCAENLKPQRTRRNAPGGAEAFVLEVFHRAAGKRCGGGILSTAQGKISSTALRLRLTSLEITVPESKAVANRRCRVIRGLYPAQLS